MADIYILCWVWTYTLNHQLSKDSKGWHHSMFSLDTGGKEIAMAKLHFLPRSCGLCSWVRLVLPASPTLKSKIIWSERRGKNTYF